MGQWVIGAIINIVGSITINFGTNLLKLGHDQSLLAALGSIQFVSNIAFAYFVLSKTVTIKVLAATAFIVFGNIFLVSFGNHQSPVYTPEQLVDKYSNLVFLLYCLMLILVVIANHYMYRKGEASLSIYGHDFNPYWRMILPFSYAIVSGAVGSCSVLFAKSISNMLRLTMSSSYHLHSWFTYSLLLLFFSTAGFWVLDTLRITMFILGMSFVFIGIILLAPDDSKGGETKDSYSLTSSPSQSLAPDVKCTNASTLTQETEINFRKSFILENARTVFAKAKASFSLSIGLCEESINASSVLVMPMVSSRATGFRATIFDRAKFIPLRTAGWSESTLVEDDDIERQDRVSLLS